jgi:anti-sigma regulatory factor (Ser/Thr protein kinase)
VSSRQTDEAASVSDVPSIVTLELPSIPENLTLVRGMLGGVAELLQMDPELLDDLKTAVSEAANNVVMHAYGGEPGPLKVKLYVTDDGVLVVVRDEGVGMATLSSAEDRQQGVGMPVMQALAQRADFRAGESGGTEVRMLFSAERDGRPMFGSPVAPAPEDGWTERLSGDALISISPVTLLPSVLGRLARAIAATARFSLDRFSDVYLVTDSISAHAVRAATSQRMGFSLKAAPRRLELTIGPFKIGSTDELAGDRSGSKSPLVLLSDELSSELDGDGSELLRVVMVDHRR